MVKLIIVGQDGSEKREDSLVSGLSEAEQLRADRIGKRLKREAEGRVFLLYSSDRSRTRQAADIIAGHLGLGIAEDMRLREICKAAEGESWQDFYKRICNCLNGKCGDGRENNMILVTHGCCLTYTAAWWAKRFNESCGEDYIVPKTGEISIMLIGNLRRAVYAS
jgi:probable phosphoglycerate mutase